MLHCTDASGLGGSFDFALHRHKTAEIEELMISSNERKIVSQISSDGLSFTNCLTLKEMIEFRSLCLKTMTQILKRLAK